jgi:putative Mg2+ transporter-C (MgtC) family protein
MDLSTAFSYSIFLRLAIAMLLGLAIGMERIYAHKSAGMRTYALVSMGSALFILISEAVGVIYANSPSFNPTLIASSIITGIGFLGAGMIIFRDSRLVGITTASGIWVSAGIGIACGFGLYALAIMTTVLMLFIFLVIWMVEQQLKNVFKENEEENK